MKGLKVIALLVIAVVVPLGSSYNTAVATTDASYYFAETGHTVKGAFLNYWEQNGGLMRQGYPLTDELNEVSDLDGKSYTVQYFERAVFEYHPENQAPYNVLLSQLGTFRYKQKYPNGAPSQAANPDSAITFPQTGKTLGGGFRHYWEQDGGLAQFGYPISNEFAEVSDLNAQTYTVQYFERAVFEYHPENRPPYDVLLSQLGRFRYDSVHSPQPVPGGSQLIASTLLGKSIATGNYLFWIDTRNSMNNGRSVYGYDIRKQAEFVVSDKPSNKFYLITDGKTLAWAETDVAFSIGNASIQGYDISTGKQFTIMPPMQGLSELDGIGLDNNILYYTDLRTGHVGIYAHDLATGQEHLISAVGSDPVAKDGVLLWLEGRNLSQHGPSETDLHMLKLDGSKVDTIVTTGTGGLIGYGVSGDDVVWSYSPVSPNHGVYLYSIGSGATRTLTSETADNAIISGNLVAWTNEPVNQPSRSWSISVYNTDTGSVTTLVQDSTTLVQAIGITSQNQLAYTVEPASSAILQLYLIGLK